MKAERRHELKENDLVHFLYQARDYLGERANQILLIVVVVVAVIAVVSWSLRSSSRAVDDAYAELSSLTFADVESGRESLGTLKMLSESSSDEAFILRALILRGEQAVRLAGLTDPAPDPGINSQAEEAFTELLDRFGDNILALGVAHSGLATVAENQFVIDGNPAHKDTARRHLDAIKTNTALNGTPFMSSALDRLNMLDETFVVVKFAPPAPKEEPVAEQDTEDRPISNMEMMSTAERMAVPRAMVAPVEEEESPASTPTPAGEPSSEQSAGPSPKPDAEPSPKPDTEPSPEPAGEGE